jgi:hypothetical protein
MSQVQRRGLLEASHQTKKLDVAGYLTIGAIVVVYLAKGDWLDPIVRLIVGAVAVAVGTIGAFYALFSVRCPECKLRWVWWSLKNQPHTRWLHWLYEFTECPRCKHRES